MATASKALIGPPPTKRRRAQQRRANQAYRTRHPERYLWGLAKRRARKNRIRFNIRPEDIVFPADGHCPVLGIPLRRNHGGGAGNDNSPSLDRIIPVRGYVRGNVIVVSQRANQIKSNATVIELMRVATFYGNLIDKNPPHRR